MATELEIAAGFVRDSAADVERQQRRILVLDLYGFPTGEARAALAALRDGQEELEHHLQFLTDANKGKLG